MLCGVGRKYCASSRFILQYLPSDLAFTYAASGEIRLMPDMHHAANEPHLETAPMPTAQQHA